MSLVSTPSEMPSAAGNLAGIGSPVAARATAIHDMFVNTLRTSAGFHAAPEVANAVATGGGG